MKSIKNFDNVKNLYDSLHNALENNDKLEIEKCLESIDFTEEEFLQGYSRKKKEGVYYTQRSISDFIVSQALLLLVNKNVEQLNINSLDQILNLDIELREKISKLLLRLKIFDPACGSGVFLISAVNQIFTIIKKVNPNKDNFEFIPQILKNVYGFDINDYAVKLSILNLFKWYHKDYKANLFKIFSRLSSNFRSEDSLSSLINNKFDVVVGNPPYGNILTKTQKEFLKEEDVYHNDVYCAFILKAVEWSSGIIGFLVPKSFLLRQNYIEFRNILLKKTNILKIFDIGPNLFKRATNEVQIILYEKKSESPEPLLVYNFPNEKVITYKDQEVDSLRICFNIECPLCSKSKKLFVYTVKSRCPYCNHLTTPLNRINIKSNKEIYNMIKKLENVGDLNYLNVRDFPKMIRGEEDKGLKQIKSLINSNLKGTCLFINAKNDFDYYYFTRDKSFDLKNVHAALLKGVNYEFYTSPKLLIKHNNIYPQAIFTEENVCFSSSIYSLLYEDILELKYLCALLNSSLMQFYCIYGINNQKSTTINLNQYMIRHLPIKDIETSEKKIISEKVDFISNFLKDNKGIINEDTKAFIREIDDLIFQTYSLSFKESSLIKSEVKNQIEFYNKIYSSVK